MLAASERISFLEQQLHDLLSLVERGGILLRDNAAVLEEFGGDLNDLRMIVGGHARIGDGMVRAVARTREKVWPEQ